MRRNIALVLVALVAVALVAVGAAQGAPSKVKGTLRGTVGPGFTITLSKKTVKAGTYKFVIKDKASIHNFHIKGPGVNKSTSVPKTGTTTWTLKLKKGSYKFMCDPHRSTMHGTLKVT